MLIDSAIYIDTYLHTTSLANSLINLAFRYYQQYYILSIISLQSSSFTDWIIDINSIQPCIQGYNIKLSFRKDTLRLFGCCWLHLGYLFRNSLLERLTGLTIVPEQVLRLLGRMLRASATSCWIVLVHQSVSKSNCISGILELWSTASEVWPKGVTTQFLIYPDGNTWY